MDDEQGREPVEELTLEPPAPVRSNRSRALWAVLAFFGLVAGGLVVSSAGDEEGELRGLPVDLASASRSGSGAAEADAMLAWVVYVPGDDLPALGGEATAYRLGGEVDEARVRELAGALGLEGAVESDGAGSWWVTGDGGQGQLRVHGGGAGGWVYFAGYSDCVTEDGGVVGCSTCASEGDAVGCTDPGIPGSKPVCEDGTDCPALTTTTSFECPPDAGCTQPCDGSEGAGECGGGAGDVGDAEQAPGGTGSGCADDCIAPDAQPVEPAPPVPPEGTSTPPDDVARVALDVVAASGVDVDDAIVTGLDGGGEGGTGSWYVTVEPRLDGVPSGLISWVEVGPDLHVISGNGSIGQPEPLGEYPLLDTRAAIERANAQTGILGGIEPALGEADAAGTTTGGATDAGGTDVGGTDDLEATVTTIVNSTDPCAAPDGAADGCGGATGCGGDGCVEPTTTIPCKVQPDGTESCELECSVDVAIGTEGTAGGTDGSQGSEVEVQPCALPDCPQPLPPEDSSTADDTAASPPVTVDCTPPPVPEPGPVPEPEPVEIVLVDAERSLVLLPANDGSADAYLVPAYRFTAADGGTVDLPAVADEALSGPVTTETTAPEPVPEPEPLPVPDPQPCEVLEESGPEGESATTHTIQTCPTPNEEDALEIGGDGYHVDIDVECGGGTFALGGRIWITDDEDVAGWADPGERHQGGIFTLEAEDHGTFVGDADGTLTAEFRRLGAAEDIFCTPQPRT